MVNKLTEILSPLSQNTYIFIMSSLLVYLLGGFDDTLLTLLFLNIIDFLLNFCSIHKTKIMSKIRIYIYIMLAVIIDRTLNFDIQLRQYLIICFQYNEISSILTKLSEDTSIKIPNKLKNILKTIDNQIK